MNLSQIALEVKKAILNKKSYKLSRLADKIAQELRENPYLGEVAISVKDYLEKNKSVLLLNSGLSGLDTYVAPNEVTISVKSDVDGFVVNFMLPDLKTSAADKLVNMLTKNIYNLLEKSEFKDYNFSVIVSS